MYFCDHLCKRGFKRNIFILKTEWSGIGSDNGATANVDKSEQQSRLLIFICSFTRNKRNQINAEIKLRRAGKLKESATETLLKSTD